MSVFNVKVLLEGYYELRIAADSGEEAERVAEDNWVKLIGGFSGMSPIIWNEGEVGA